MNVTHLRDRVEALPKQYHKDVARILFDSNIAFDENKNGLFINLSTVPQEVLEKMARFVTYIDLQQQTLSTGETERQEIKTQFFH